MVNQRAKQNMRDQEFAADKGNCLDTVGEEGSRRCVERFAHEGAIPDLGGGSGMSLARRLQNIRRALLQKYGSEAAKRRLWNSEYATGRWNCLDNASDQSARMLVEKYVNGGGILDLGCGTGTLGIALSRGAYSFYTGLDVSDVALEKARQRAQECSCADRNEYCLSDILIYEPTRKYKVILYGDSIYYIPLGKIAPMLERYSGFLAEGGVFIARLFEATGKRLDIINMIQSDFHVLESQLDPQTLAYHVVFRPNGRSN